MVMFLLVVLAILPGFVQASSGAPAPAEGGYRFEVRWQGKSFSYDDPKNTWEAAYRNAAAKCFTHFRAQRDLASADPIELINACANPRMVKGSAPKS